jgi:hypothetical protein
MDNVKIAELIVAALTALGSSFAGAYFAFKWNRDREDEKMLDSRVEACNKAIFVLSQQLRVLRNFQTQYVEPHRSSKYRHFEMLPIIPLDTTGLHLDPGSLAFLLETEARDIPGLVAVENARFHSAVSAIAERSEMHRREFQPALSDLAKRGELGPGRSDEDVDKLLGARISRGLKVVTDQVIDAVDEAIISLSSAGSTVPPLLKHVLGVPDRLIKFSLAGPDSPAPLGAGDVEK